MTFERLGKGALDYIPCRYGASKLLFRGPRKPLNSPYCAVIGGSETYGQFLEEPYTDLLATRLGKPVVNLGVKNAGTDVFAYDETVLRICSEADITVIQIMGAQNLSNQYYSVHPRRNDRFLKASGLLHAIYRDLDFTDFHFTGHLLNVLAEVSPAKFASIREELKETWVKRMRYLLDRIGGAVVLLWLADHTPEANSDENRFGPGPVFVDREMLNSLTDRVSDIVEVISTEDEVVAGLDRMIFTVFEELVAQEMLGPIIHENVSSKLFHSIERLQ